MSEEVKEGWGKPFATTRKFHYFQEGRSLCGSYGWLFGELQPDGGKKSPDDCATCRKKLDAQRAKAGQEGNKDV